MTSSPAFSVLLHTNHFLAPRIDPVDLSLWAMPDSAVRLQRLTAGARQASTSQASTSQASTSQASPAGAVTLDGFRALLADHADYPISVCAHPDPAAHPCEQGATIASVLMDLTERRIWVAAGNPCQVPYQQLEVL